MWAVSRHRDAVAVLTTPEVYSAAMPDLLGLQPAPVQQRLAELGVAPFTRNVLVTDPPEHTALRRRDRGLFSLGAATEREPVMRAHARRHAGEIAAALDRRPSGQVDLVEASTAYVRGLLGALCGITDVDLDRMDRWGQDMITLLEPGDASTIAAKLAAAEGMARWDDWVRDWAAGGAAASGLLAAVTDTTDLINWVRSVQLAGINITRDALAAVLHTALTEPALWRHAGEIPETVPAIVAEGLRRHAVHQGLIRTVLVDTELGGVALDAGHRVLVNARHANLDPATYTCPHRAVLGRSNIATHLAWGAGPHRCIAMPLAERLLCVAVEEWARALPDLHAAADPGWAMTWNFARLTALPVRRSPTTPTPAR
jgi:cytochrome P450